MKSTDNIQTSEIELWHILHVRPRCEKKTARYCDSVNIEHYLPLRSEQKVYQRRKVNVFKPLFPGYVFTKFSISQRILVLKSRQIVRILEVKNQAVLIDELHQIQKALEVNPCLSACSAVKKGMRVRIISGAFKGLEGMVIRLKGQKHVVLNVDLIGRGLLLEAGLETLETL